MRKCCKNIGQNQAHTFRSIKNVSILVLIMNIYGILSNRHISGLSRINPSFYANGQYYKVQKKERNISQILLSSDQVQKHYLPSR